LRDCEEKDNSRAKQSARAAANEMNPLTVWRDQAGMSIRIRGRRARRPDAGVRLLDIVCYMMVRRTVAKCFRSPRRFGHDLDTIFISNDRKGSKL